LRHFRIGDAFDLFVHYEHVGDFDAAVRAYAENAGRSYDGQHAGGAGFDWSAKKAEDSAGEKAQPEAGGDSAKAEAKGASNAPRGDVPRPNRAGLDTKADLDPALDALKTGSLIGALTPKTQGAAGASPPARSLSPRLRRACG
jgi:hypothetical protein